ncbi:MAG: sigma-70 family RNA polymerase sigma factor [Candidatus Omnitrophica bacterium]|nr:sigma-70 family RNA polymerase sigma factor [Candidatus Omnitrophota bacterium]
MDKGTRASDSELVERCIEKDLTAWAQLIKKYSRLIYVSIVNRLKAHGISLSHHDIEDIRQNLLAGLWEGDKLQGVRNRASIAYWLAIVSGNEAMEYAGSRRLYGAGQPASAIEKMEQDELAEIVPSLAQKPSDALIKDELSNRIEEAFETLPDKERLIIKLNLLYDKKYHEIADMLGMPPGTISSYIKRAKEKLRSELKDLS